MFKAQLRKLGETVSDGEDDEEDDKDSDDDDESGKAGSDID